MAALRDWTEDFSHENGQYLCQCILCEAQFVGHKRRCVCKACAVENEMIAKPRSVQLVELLIGPPLSDEFRQRLQKIKGAEAYKYARPGFGPTSVLPPRPAAPAPPPAPEPAPPPEIKRDPRAHWVTALRPSMWANFAGFLDEYGHAWDQFYRVDAVHRADFSKAWRHMEKSHQTFKVPPAGNWAIKMPWGNAIAGHGAQGRTIYGRNTSPSWVSEHLIDNPYIEQRWNDEYARYRAGI